MHTGRKSRYLAILSISLLLVSVLCMPIKSVLGDSSQTEIQKQEQLAEQKAQAYLNQFEKRSGYGQFNVTSTDESGVDVTSALSQAEQSVEQQGEQYLKHIARSNVAPSNSTTTDESGKNRNAEIEKAEASLTQQDQQYMQTTNTNYNQLNVTSTDESGSNRNTDISQAELYLEAQFQQYLQQFANPGYVKINSIGTNESDLVNKTGEMVQAEQSVEQQGEQYLQHIERSQIAPPNSTSTDESGKNRNAEIEQAKLALEKEDQALIASMYPKLAQKEYGSK